MLQSVYTLPSGKCLRAYYTNTLFQGQKPLFHEPAFQRKSNPRSSKTLKVPPRRLVRLSGQTTRPAASSRSRIFPCRSAFCEKLGKPFARPMDPRHCHRKQNRVPLLSKTTMISRRESEKVQIMIEEIYSLRAKNAVARVTGSSEGFGSWHPVVNLKSLNQFVVAHHFKMESIRTLKGMLQPRDWLVKLDLKDAYLTIPVHPSHQ